ncbi:MAG: tyrosine-type recombinase/integrase [Candidatus Rokubacteria bacterium]|nr:tyrosine-type recombinase/integrase [Candidatus Rokubacteria bacterium]MBI3108154.1 tyrosine-type recombinase/integrase [Candidatus Rokubacteria bacterium]
MGCSLPTWASSCRTNGEAGAPPAPARPKPLRGPLTRECVTRVFHRARWRAHITKHVSPSSLRHACAAHMLESGTNLRVIRTLLGHRSLRTTQRDPHVADTSLRDTRRPLDRLPDLAACRRPPRRDPREGSGAPAGPRGARRRRARARWPAHRSQPHSAAGLAGHRRPPPGGAGRPPASVPAVRPSGDLHVLRRAIAGHPRPVPVSIAPPPRPSGHPQSPPSPAGFVHFDGFAHRGTACGVSRSVARRAGRLSSLCQVHAHARLGRPRAPRPTPTTR